MSLLLSDDDAEEVVVERKRLTKKLSPSEKRQRDVFDDFEFMQSDDDAPKGVDEESEDLKDFVVEDNYDHETKAQVLDALGIEDEEPALREAFYILSQGHWNTFLELPVIQQKFGPAHVLMDSFGNGSHRKVVRLLWLLTWKTDLKVKLTEGHEGKCICCGHKRYLPYDMYVKSTMKLIGSVGTDCHQIKFIPLMKLAAMCRKMSHTSAEPLFYKWICEDLANAMDKIGEACTIMKKKYEEYQKKKQKVGQEDN